MTGSHFIIDKQWLLHEGGTKFYQVLRIIDSSTARAATVTHWGKHIGAYGQIQIQLRGQTKVEEGDKYVAAIKLRRNRGYKDKLEHGTSSRLNQKELEEYLLEELGAVDSATVSRHLGLVAEEAAWSDPEVDDEDTPARKAVKKEKRAPKPIAEKPAAAAELDGWGDF